MRNIRIAYHLGQPRNEIKGNRSMGKLGKVNPAILYMNELDPEKQTIAQEFIWPNTPKRPSMENMKRVKK